MKRYTRPVTDVHEMELMQVVMFSVWDEMGEEGQFSHTADFEEDENDNDSPRAGVKWDRF